MLRRAKVSGADSPLYTNRTFDNDTDTEQKVPHAECKQPVLRGINYPEPRRTLPGVLWVEVDGDVLALEVYCKSLRRMRAGAAAHRLRLRLRVHVER